MIKETDVQIQQMTRRIVEKCPELNFDIILSNDAQRAQILQKLLDDCESDLAIADNYESGSLSRMRTTEFTSMIISVLLDDGKADLLQMLSEFAEISAGCEDCLDQMVEAWKKVSSFNKTGTYTLDTTAKSSQEDESLKEDF